MSNASESRLPHASEGASAPATVRTWPRLSIRPGINRLHSLIGRRQPDIIAAAVDRWEIAPASALEVRPARMLDGQIDRIKAAEFGSIAEVVKDFRGGSDAMQAPTMGYRIKDAWLIDGVLYAGGAVRHLRPRSTLRPAELVPGEPLRAALYESWLGNRWFGNWLFDDCLAYMLAQQAGRPFTSRVSIGHMPTYERALGMRPLRRTVARFEELLLFDDHPNNEHKRARADQFRLRLTGERKARHPGVFLLRGHSGDRRLLVNERAIAERLAAKRGFTILDPCAAGLDEIIDICSEAMVVAGVEGSHLVHGLMLMPPEARAFVIQPPDRTVSALKRLADRQGQDFATLIGVGTHEAFSVDGDEVERTLDLP
ncbi:glycosyltransferase 61 family protein [Sphingobium bisphenolivorans]|uniref:glycosyltransferase 61 family protein n=1 Tax=Sphingobium bisphenolivorans TaxID=1335760 RepID=UPI0003A16130|nr:glycosyltransferase family 61 protein [Sphingobium bisphenolivorans]